MVSNSETKMVRKAFISYLDDNGQKVEGFFEIVAEHPRLKIKSGKNTLTIPEGRLLKIKEANNE